MRTKWEKRQRKRKQKEKGKLNNNEIEGQWKKNGRNTKKDKK